MDIKKLNEAIAKALNEDTFYDTFDALKIEIANDLDNGSLGNNDFELEAHIEGIDIKDLRKRFREIVLSGIAECVREGTNCMDAMEVLISKDSIKAEDFDDILEDLYNLFNKSDDEIEEIRNGKELILYCNWSIELPLNESVKPVRTNKKVIKEGTGIFHGETLAKVPKEEWVGKIITVPYDKADYEIVELDDEDNMAVLKNIKTGETARMGYKGLQNPLGYMYYLQGTGIEESVIDKKVMKESHSFTKDELANNRFVKLYQKCYEYRKEHPEMEAYEIANKLCFNANEGWVNTDEIAQTWADMFVYDGAKDEDFIQKIREDIIEMIEEYLLDDEQDGDFE